MVQVTDVTPMCAWHSGHSSVETYTRYITYFLMLLAVLPETRKLFSSIGELVRVDFFLPTWRWDHSVWGPHEGENAWGTLMKVGPSVGCTWGWNQPWYLLYMNMYGTIHWTFHSISHKLWGRDILMKKAFLPCTVCVPLMLLFRYTLHVSLCINSKNLHIRTQIFPS